MSTISKHHPKTGHKNARAERGLALFREGAVSEHGDLFTVEGASRNYTVSVVDGEPRCDCPDFGKRRVACKHGFAVVVHAAKKNAGCRRQRTACPAGAPARRHGEGHGTPRDDRRDARRGTAPGRSGGIDPAAVRANLDKMGG